MRKISGEHNDIIIVQYSIIVQYANYCIGLLENINV